MSFQPPPTSATYPYGSYPSAHYSANLQTWPYYTPAQSTSKPATTTTTTTTTTASTSTQPRAATFSSYTPSTARESVATSSTGRGARKQVNIKGLFTKEREYSFLGLKNSNQNSSVKNLMYGFGDDRNPANDTVNVMEEILVEYITDVVRPSYCVG